MVIAEQTRAVVQDYDDDQLTLFTGFLRRLNEAVYHTTRSLYR